MSRNDHPNKEIRKAIDYALERGWRLEKSGGRAHSWGTLYCPHGERGGYYENDLFCRLSCQCK